MALVMLIGCRDSDNHSSLIFEELNESLERSNKSIELSTVNTLNDLDIRKEKPGTAEKAIYWGSKAYSVKSKTTELVWFVDSLLLNLKESNTELPEEDVFNLYDKLKSYRHFALTVESGIGKEFNGKLPVFSNNFLASFANKSLFRDIYFKAKVELAKSALIKFKNDLKVSENMLIAYCNNQSIPGCGLNMRKFQAIAVANSTKLGVGDELIIQVGVGEFDNSSKPDYLINGVNVLSNEKGVGEYKINVGNKIGKHKVKIKISYTAQDGIRDSLEKDIEYTVVE